jgi:hypothetical protein
MHWSMLLLASQRCPAGLNKEKRRTIERGVEQLQGVANDRLVEAQRSNVQDVCGCAHATLTHA